MFGQNRNLFPNTPVGGSPVPQRLIVLLRQPGNRTSTVSLGDRRDQGWKRAEAGDGRQR